MATRMLCQGEMEKLVIASMLESALPCGGCKYSRQFEKQWERFTNEVDNVVPLTTRRVIQPEQPEPDCN